MEVPLSLSLPSTTFLLQIQCLLLCKSLALCLFASLFNVPILGLFFSFEFMMMLCLIISCSTYLCLSDCVLGLIHLFCLKRLFFCEHWDKFSMFFIGGLLYELNFMHNFPNNFWGLAMISSITFMFNFEWSQIKVPRSVVPKGFSLLGDLSYWLWMPTTKLEWFKLQFKKWMQIQA